MHQVLPRPETHGHIIKANVIQASFLLPQETTEMNAAESQTVFSCATALWFTLMHLHVDISVSCGFQGETPSRKRVNAQKGSVPRAFML